MKWINDLPWGWNYANEENASYNINEILSWVFKMTKVMTYSELKYLFQQK